MEDRLIDIETRIAFQEATLAQLNEVVTEQQAQIARLERICRELAERAAAGGDGAVKGTPADEVPPHY